MDFLFDFIFKLLSFITGSKKLLPDFDFNCERMPMSDNNPLLFLVNISNKSERDYSVTKALVFKRNEKTKKLLVRLVATIKDTDILPANNLKTREEVESRSKEILLKLKSATDKTQLKIPAKESKMFFVYYELDPKSYEYWNNFRRKTAVQGFVDEEGKVYPAWCKSEEWELALEDDRNIYWIMNRKMIDFPVLEEEWRLNNHLSAKIKEGEKVLLKMIKYYFRILLFKIKYRLKKISLLFGVNNL